MKIQNSILHIDHTMYVGTALECSISFYIYYLRVMRLYPRISFLEHRVEEYQYCSDLTEESIPMWLGSFRTELLTS